MGSPAGNPCSSLFGHESLKDLVHKFVFLADDRNIAQVRFFAKIFICAILIFKYFFRSGSREGGSRIKTPLNGTRRSTPYFEIHVLYNFLLNCMGGTMYYNLKALCTKNTRIHIAQHEQ